MDGTLVAINDCSGHYKTSVEMMRETFAHFERVHGLSRDGFAIVHRGPTKVGSWRIPLNMLENLNPSSIAADFTFSKVAKYVQNVNLDPEICQCHSDHLCTESSGRSQEPKSRVRAWTF